MNSPGDSIERSTWDSAAKLTTAPQPSTAARTASRSAMSPSTSSTRSGGRSSRFSLPPRVGQLVVDRDRVIGVRGEAVADVAGADEPGAAGDEQPHRRADLERLALGEIGREALPPARKRRRVRALAAEHRVGGARRAAREHVGRAGHHAAVGARLVEDLLGELVPRARSAAGEVMDAVGVALDQLRDRGGEMGGVGRAADLVGDDEHLGLVGADREHRLDEVAPADAVEP